MKVLIVSKTQTHPIHAGNCRFILNQVELLKSLGHDVHFLFIETRGFSRKYANMQKEIEEMKAYWKDHLYVYRQSRFQMLKTILLVKWRLLSNNGYTKCDDYYPSGLSSYTKKLNDIHHFDCCIINYYILSKLFVNVRFPLEAVTTHDYFGFKNVLIGGGKRSWMATTPNEEGKALQRCSHIFALNTEEASYFSKLSPKSTVYNVFSTYSYNSVPLTNNKVLLFMGAGGELNLHGLQWFLNDIFPAIVKRFPDVRLKIAGTICKLLKDNRDPHIDLVGFVENEADFYKLGDVAVNPTFEGTGLKIKTFESIAYDKVVMVHPHSTIGIYKPEEAPIFSSIDANEWVSFLEKVWGNENEIMRIKENNRRYIEEMNSFVYSEYKRFFGSYC